jgi:hypothetical protein
LIYERKKYKKCYNPNIETHQLKLKSLVLFNYNFCIKLSKFIFLKTTVNYNFLEKNVKLMHLAKKVVI